MAEQPKLMLVVRNLKSRLPREELERRMQERMPEFRALPGLVQKYYSYNPEKDEWAGIYLWADKTALAAYRESELRKTIPSAYELTTQPVLEVYPLVDQLRQ